MKRDEMTFNTWFTGEPETKDVQAHMTCDQIDCMEVIGPSMGDVFAAMIEVLIEEQLEMAHSDEADD